jgi:hypothetical protein
VPAAEASQNRMAVGGGFSLTAQQCTYL